MTPDDCIRAAIPGADEALCEHIVWGRTPFPFTKLSAREFYKAASRWKRAQDHGIRLCDWCDNIAVDDGWNCQACIDALTGRRSVTIGAAHIVILTGPAAFMLTDIVGKEFSVYKRAVRTYRPGLNTDNDDNHRHPLAMARQ